MRISVSHRDIVCESKKGEWFVIPVDEIDAIVYDRKVHNRAIQFLKKGPYSHSDPTLPSLVVTGILIGTTAAILLPFSSKDHFVHLCWSQSGSAKLAAFEIGKEQCRRFLEQLEAVSGRRWLDLPGKRKLLAEALERERKNRVPFDLERTVAEL